MRPVTDFRRSEANTAAKDRETGEDHQPRGTARKKDCSPEAHQMREFRNRMHLKGGFCRSQEIARYIEPYARDQLGGQSDQGESLAKVPQ